MARECAGQRKLCGTRSGISRKSSKRKKQQKSIKSKMYEGIYLRDGKERARAFLAEQVKVHPENTQLRSMLDDWADIANGFEQERTMHSKSPSTSP